MTADDSMNEGSVRSVSIVGEYIDVFPDELRRLPFEREIEFCIDLVSIRDLFRYVRIA